MRLSVCAGVRRACRDIGMVVVVQRAQSRGWVWAYLSPRSPQVIPFAADCDQDECTCRDPAAEENQ